MTTVEDMLGTLTPLYDQIQCAFCLNTHATNKVVIEDKAAPIDSSFEMNGKAMAFLCDDHKKEKPKYAHKVYDNNTRITLVDINDLPTIGKVTADVHDVPPQPGPMPEGPPAAAKATPTTTTTASDVDASVKAQESPPSS